MKYGYARVSTQVQAREGNSLEKQEHDLRAAGAEKIYAKGHPYLESYPLHTAIWKMRRLREGLPETDAALFPVLEKTIENFLFFMEKGCIFEKNVLKLKKT